MSDKYTYVESPPQSPKPQKHMKMAGTFSKRLPSAVAKEILLDTPKGEGSANQVYVCFC